MCWTVSSRSCFRTLPAFSAGCLAPQKCDKINARKQISVFLKMSNFHLSLQMNKQQYEWQAPWLVLRYEIHQRRRSCVTGQNYLNTCNTDMFLQSVLLQIPWTEFKSDLMTIRCCLDTLSSSIEGNHGFKLLTSAVYFWLHYITIMIIEFKKRWCNVFTLQVCSISKS